MVGTIVGVSVLVKLGGMILVAVGVLEGVDVGRSGVDDAGMVGVGVGGKTHPAKTKRIIRKDNNFFMGRVYTR
jgi:hypothetical protein